LSVSLLLAVAVAAAMVIAGLQIAGTQSGPNIALRSAPRPRTVGPGYLAPTTINDTCRTDDTVSLVRWLYTLPQGTLGDPTVVQFQPDACYEVDGSMFLRDFHYFVFSGNGATFKQLHVQVGAEFNDSGPDRDAYCGYQGFNNSVWTDFLALKKNTSTDIMFFMEGGCEITFENMNFVGTNHGPGGGPLEQDTFITFAGTDIGLVNDVNMQDPYGDYVDTQSLNEAPGPVQRDFPARNITIENSSFSGSGREGLGIVLVDGVTVTHNIFYSAALTMFDIEWDSTGGDQSDILIEDNTIVGQDYAFLVAAITGAQIHRFSFADNRLIDGAQLRIYLDPAPGSTDVRVTGNTSNQAATWPWRATVNVLNVYRVEVDHNVTPVGFWKPGNRNGGPFVNAPGALVRDNTIRGLEVLAQPGTLVVQLGGVSCSNTNAQSQPLEPVCSNRMVYPEVVPPTVAVFPEN
jgi:hypothetical protein